MLNKRIKFAIGLLLLVFALFYVLVVNAAVAEEPKKEIVFDTTEDDNSLIPTDIAVEQVKKVRFERIRAEQLAEEKRIAKEKQLAEQQRIEEEKRLAEEQRIAEEKARVKALEEEAKRQEAEEAEQKEAEQKETEQKEVEPEKEEVKETQKSEPEPEEPEEEKPVTISSKAETSESSQSLGQFQATAYTAYDGTQIGITAGGTDMANGNIWTSRGYRIIAADTSVIPMGTVIRITTSSGQEIMGQVDDTGGAINGHIIDISFASKSEAFAFGRQTVTVEIVE